MQEVRGSIPLSSTEKVRDVGWLCSPPFFRCRQVAVNLALAASADEDFMLLSVVEVFARFALSPHPCGRRRQPTCHARLPPLREAARSREGADDMLAREPVRVSDGKRYSTRDRVPCHRHAPTLARVTYSRGKQRSNVPGQTRSTSFSSQVSIHVGSRGSRSTTRMATAAVFICDR